MGDVNGGQNPNPPWVWGSQGPSSFTMLGTLWWEKRCVSAPQYVYISYMIQCRKSVIVRNQIDQVTVTMLIQESAKQRKDNTVLVPASCNMTLLQLALFPVFCFTEAQAMSLRFG